MVLSTKQTNAHCTLSDPLIVMCGMTENMVQKRGNGKILGMCQKLSMEKPPDIVVTILLIVGFVVVLHTHWGAVKNTTVQELEWKKEFHSEF